MASTKLPELSAQLSFIQNIFEGNEDEKLRDLFDFYDTDGDGKIEREELKNVLALCAHDIGLEFENYLEQIAEAVFDKANHTERGTISFNDLKEVLKLRPNLINELSLINTSSTPNRSAINNKQKKHQHQQQRRPSILNSNINNNNNSIANLTQDHHSYHSSNVKPQATTNNVGCWDALLVRFSSRLPILNKLRWEYISNNLARVAFFCSLSALLIALYSARIATYWQHCGWLIMARASGQCLNFLCSIIVLLVCRRSINHLRCRGFGEYLPLDDSVYFHKLIGWLIVIHATLHTVGHIFNFYNQSRDDNSSLVSLLFERGIGWIGGYACITGWILLLILLVMALAQPYARRFGKFELFYYTHLLYVPFWVLLFIHAPHYWCWFLVPFIIFLVETLYRVRNFLRNLTPTGPTSIIKGVPLPSGVVQLIIKRPANFHYNPGDWIYVLIPDIAKYEWHPFTISSAPEQDGVIWLHIRAVGEWTKKLRHHYEGTESRNHLRRFIKSGQFSLSIDNVLDDHHVDEQLDAAKTPQVVLQLQPMDNSQSPITIDSNPRIVSPGALKIYIDGPYGSPSSQIFRTEHAVLVATGIGVTPFASILQSIVHHYQKSRQVCPKCTHAFFDNRPPFVFGLKKVDFVWINRDQKSFEWFIKLLADLELTQSELPIEQRFLDIHIHLTAMQTSQIKSIGIQLALYLMHEKNNKDLVTGLKTRTKAGRPNWDEFFGNIQQQKRGKVTVFFCGRPQLGRLLHRSCDKFGFNFRKEVF